MERKHLRLVGSDDDDLTPIDAIARAPSVEQVVEAIRKGVCPSDRFFDHHLPCDLRRPSSQHWTPLAVALRVAEWLSGLGVRSVVDIGSGAGKFCVAAALASRCSFTGIEQRVRFVEAARTLAKRFGVDDRVRFVHGALSRDSIPAANAYYLFNHFGENLFGPDEHLSNDVELSFDRYKRDIALMEGFFEQAPIGTLVVKYNGFGGRMPPSYETVFVAREMVNVLRMWRKR